LDESSFVVPSDTFQPQSVDLFVVQDAAPQPLGLDMSSFVVQDVTPQPVGLDMSSFIHDLYPSDLTQSQALDASTFVSPIDLYLAHPELMV
jgi:hypothetical protein